MDNSPLYVITDDGTAFDLRKVVAIYNNSVTALKVCLEGSFSVMVTRGTVAEARIHEYVNQHCYTNE